MYANVMVNPWLKHWFIGDVDVDVPNIQHMLKSTVHTCQFQQNAVCVRISLLSTRLSWLDLELSAVEVWLAAVDAMFSFDGVIENFEAPVDCTAHVSIGRNAIVTSCTVS